MKLTIQNVCLGKDKAEKYILSICKDLKFPITSKKMLSEKVLYNLGKEKLEVDFLAEIKSVQKNGRAKHLQFLYDHNDTYLKIPIEMAVYSENETGLKIKLKNNYGNSELELEAPGAFEAPETSLSSDIISYRKEAVENFNNKKYEEFNKNYRAYLFSSISLVDCFLHRYNFFIKDKVENHMRFDNLKELDSISSIENRLTAWLMTFSPEPIEDIKNTKEWSKFMELKRARNRIIHPREPAIPYSVKDIVKMMNLAKDGVGGLMLKFRKSASQREFIGFIQGIKNMPDIKISKKMNNY